MPVIIWHLLAEPAACYTDLGSDCYATCSYPKRRKRDQIGQLQAIGYKVPRSRTGCTSLARLR